MEAELATGPRHSGATPRADRRSKPSGGLPDTGGHKAAGLRCTREHESVHDRRVPRNLLVASSATGGVDDRVVVATGGPAGARIHETRARAASGCRMDAETRNFWEQVCRPRATETRCARVARTSGLKRLTRRSSRPQSHGTRAKCVFGRRRRDTRATRRAGLRQPWSWDSGLTAPRLDRSRCARGHFAQRPAARLFSSR